MDGTSAFNVGQQSQNCGLWLNEKHMASCQLHGPENQQVDGFEPKHSQELEGYPTRVN